MEILGVPNQGDDDHFPDLLMARPRPFRMEGRTNASLIDILPIRSPKIAQAMRQCPRNEFAPNTPLPEALADRPIIMDEGFNISAPHMHAILLEGLDLKPGHSYIFRVLDIGSGSGVLSAYAALLVGTQGEVVGVDILKAATAMASRNIALQRERNQVFKEQAAQCTFHTHNVFLPAPAPSFLTGFDRIVSGAACPENKRELLVKLLKPEGGILVTPMIGGTLEKTVRRADRKTTNECLSIVRFKDLEVPSDWLVLRAVMAVERASFLAQPILESTFERDMSLLGNKRRLPEANEARKGAVRSRMQRGGNILFGPFDCKLLGGGWSLPAHRKLLSLRCDLFRAQSISGMRDCEAYEVAVPEEFDREAVELFLLYCYNDRLEAAELGPTAVCACMKVATYYGAPYLVHLCELGLAAYLDQSSKRSSAFKDQAAPSFLALADEYNLSHLQSCALDYIVSNLVNVATTSSYADLTKRQTDLIAAHACQQLRTITAKMEGL